MPPTAIMAAPKPDTVEHSGIATAYPAQLSDVAAAQCFITTHPALVAVNGVVVRKRDVVICADSDSTGFELEVQPVDDSSILVRGWDEDSAWQRLAYAVLLQVGTH